MSGTLLAYKVARFVLRHHPDLVRKVTSAFERRRRTANNRAREESETTGPVVTSPFASVGGAEPVDPAMLASARDRPCRATRGRPSGLRARYVSPGSTGLDGSAQERCLLEDRHDAPDSRGGRACPRGASAAATRTCRRVATFDSRSASANLRRLSPAGDCPMPYDLRCPATRSYFRYENSSLASR